MIFAAGAAEGSAAGLAARCACLFCLAHGSVAVAQSQVGVPAKGHGEVSVSVQNLFVTYHTTSEGTKVIPGTITTNTMFLQWDYGLTDRLAITVGLPYRSSKFVERTPGGAHDPANLDDDHGQGLIDDGNYHGGWQDWAVSLRYAWRGKPWLITPYVLASVPSRDYVTFAHATPGTGQWRLEAGINAARQFTPPLDNLYFRAGYSYSYMQPVDRTVNHSTLNLELGCFLTPRLTTRFVVVAQKVHNGFEFPGEFPSRTDDHYFYHDQNLRNDFINIGAGLDYRLTERDRLFVNYGRTVWGENTHLIKYAVGVGYGRAF